MISPADLKRISISGSVYPSVLLSVRRSFHPSVGPSIRPSILPSVCRSFHPSVLPSVRPSFHPSCHPSVCPAIRPTVLPSVRWSVHHTFTNIQSILTPPILMYMRDEDRANSSTILTYISIRMLFLQNISMRTTLTGLANGIITQN